MMLSPVQTNTIKFISCYAFEQSLNNNDNIWTWFLSLSQRFTNSTAYTVIKFGLMKIYYMDIHILSLFDIINFLVRVFLILF